MAGRFTLEAIFKATDRLTRPVKKMQSRVSRFTSGALKGFRSLNRMVNVVGRSMMSAAKFGIAAATTGIIALSLAVRAFTKEADDLAKTSRLLDFDIEKLQEWRFAAGVAGMTTEGFDKALEQFTKRVGEARAGTGSMVTLLRKSNPELLKQLVNTKDNAKAFEIFVKALGKTKGAQDQVALANAAGGRSAAKLALLAKLHSKELEALFIRQRENGNITKEQAKAAEEFNDQMLATMNALKGFRNQVLAPLLPLLTKAASFVRDWTIANREMITSKVLTFFRDMVANWDQIVAKGRKFITVAKWVFGLVIALKALIAVLTVVNLLMSLNPVGLIIIGIAALIIGIAALIIWWDDLVATFQSMPLWLKIVAGLMTWMVATPIMGMIQAARFLLKAWEPVTIFFGALFIGIRKEFDEFLIFVGFVSDTAGRLFAKLPEPLKAAFMVVVDFIKWQLDILLGIIDGALSGLRAVTDFLEITDPEDPGAPSTSTAAAGARGNAATTMQPQDRNESLSRSEVTIRDESGRGEITKKPTDPNSGNIKLMPSGAF